MPNGCAMVVVQIHLLQRMEQENSVMNPMILSWQKLFEEKLLKRYMFNVRLKYKLQLTMVQVIAVVAIVVVPVIQVTLNRLMML